MTAETPAHVTGSYYGAMDLQARAEAGDLFVWHVLVEGRPLYDPLDTFPTLRASFRLRPSYATDVARAAALAWMFARFGTSLDERPLAARRVAWSARSILIGRSAEAGRPQFSAEALAEFAWFPETPRLIAQKTRPGLSPEAIADLRRFLGWSALRDPKPDARRLEGYRDHVRATDNQVGLHLVDAKPLTDDPQLRDCGQGQWRARTTSLRRESTPFLMAKRPNMVGRLGQRTERRDELGSPAF